MPRANSLLISKEGDGCRKGAGSDGEGLRPGTLPLLNILFSGDGVRDGFSANGSRLSRK